MYGIENPWSGNNPFQTQNLDQLQAQYQNQLDTLNRMKASQVNIMDEINKELRSMTKEEQSILYESQEYQMAKNLYESGFLQFISGKFSLEYLGTDTGKEAANNLLGIIKSSREKIEYKAKVKNEKINKILELLEKDPEMRKRYDELNKDNDN